MSLIFLRGRPSKKDTCRLLSIGEMKAFINKLRQADEAVKYSKGRIPLLIDYRFILLCITFVLHSVDSAIYTVSVKPALQIA
jgi:hypothetical protein